MKLKIIERVFVGLFATTFVAGLYAQSLSDGVYPMARDATIRDLVASYSPDENCTSRFLEEFKITLSECTAKVALAKRNCPALIAEGLTSELDEKHLYKLVGRSKVCILVTIWGTPYNSEAADHASEEMWKKDHPTNNLSKRP